MGSSILSATITSIKDNFPDHNNMQYIMGESYESHRWDDEIGSDGGVGPVEAQGT